MWPVTTLLVVSGWSLLEVIRSPSMFQTGEEQIHSSAVQSLSLSELLQGDSRRAPLRLVCHGPLPPFLVKMGLEFLKDLGMLPSTGSPTE
ncbi:MAG: hypothetical protein Q9180_007139 [Flavoplaca navasiana]